MESKKLYNIKMTLKPEHIMTFISGLHADQLDMIDLAVSQKEAEGFPEARAVIEHIMKLK